VLTYKYLLIVSYYIFFRNCQVDSRSPCNKIKSCPNGRTLVLSKCSYFLTILLALINIQRVKGKAANVTNTRPTPPPVVLRQTPPSSIHPLTQTQTPTDRACQDWAARCSVPVGAASFQLFLRPSPQLPSFPPRHSPAGRTLNPLLVMITMMASPGFLLAYLRAFVLLSLFVASGLSVDNFLFRPLLLLLLFSVFGFRFGVLCFLAFVSSCVHFISFDFLWRLHWTKSI